MTDTGTNPANNDRRRFLKAVIQGSAVVIAAITAIPGIGLLVAPVLNAGKAKKRKLVFAKPDDSKSSTFVPVRFEHQEETSPGLFFKIEGGRPMVLWARCPHAGCAVEWHA